MSKNHLIWLALSGIAICSIWQAFVGISYTLSMSWDAFGYYYYLPLTFIEDSLIITSLDDIRPIFEKYDPSSTLYQFSVTDSGNIIIRYPAGQTLLYLPFFLIGHLAALVLGYPIDGFSEPYDFAIRAGGVVYNILGFYFISKILRHKYDGLTVALTIAIIYFGTNALLNLYALSAHGSLIFLLAVLFYYTNKYFEFQTFRYSIIVAMAFGLVCLTRPTDFIAILPLVFWPWIMGGNLKNTWQSIFRKHRSHLITGTLIVFCVGLIQFGYWKHVGGSWIINSYDNPAEGLDLLSPHTIPFLFSFKTGWFIYTPLMFLVVSYLLFRLFKGDKAMIPIALYLAVFIYLASAWTNYWYGAAFSQRAMIQTYVILSLVLAALINDLRNHSSDIRRLSSSILIGLLVLLNLWQSAQYVKNVFTGNTMTKEYYFAAFFDFTPDSSKSHLLALDRTGFQLNPIREIPEGYKLIGTYKYPLKEGENLKDVEFAGEMKLEYEKFCPRDHCWLHFTVETEDSLKEELLLVAHFQNSSGNYYYRAFDMADNGFSLDRWLITPHVRNESDTLKTYFWNRSKSEVEITQARLMVYAPE